MADLSIFKLDSEIITIKDGVARQTADNAKTLATTASDNATTAKQTADSAKTLATTASDNATTAKQTADSAKTLATTASDNATTALNKINELESEISALNSSLSERYVYAPNGPVILANYDDSLLTFILAQYAKGYCAGDIALNGACTDSPQNDGWGYAVHWQMYEDGRFIVTAVRPYTYKFYLREIKDSAWLTGWKVSAAMTDV